jgi:hypothetical protein
MRVITAKNGKQMVVYDGVNDPPDWWKHVKIPRPVDRWRWVKRLLILLAIVAGLWFAFKVLVPVLVLSAILSLHSLAGRSVRGQRRE